MTTEINGMVITDTHVGSICAPWHPDYETPEGNTYGMNEGQQLLWDYFKDVGREAERRKIDLILQLDDVVDGSNYYGKGRGLMTPDLNVQTKVAELMFKDAILSRNPNAHIYSVTGTNYHHSVDYDLTTHMMDNLRVFLKEHRDSDLKGNPVHHYPQGFKNLGVKAGESEANIFFRHGSSRAFIYIAQMLQRESWSAARAVYEGKVPNVDLIFMGHNHTWLSISQARPQIALCPCWKTVDVWSGKKRYFNYQPDIGCAFFKVSEKRFHPLRVTANIEVDAVLYRPPRILDSVSLWEKQK